MQGPRYARYISGRDYHEEITERLERVMRTVAERSGLGQALRWKACVDTSAVLERSWAALAGLGWIGKNTLLIHPKLGSYLFLAEVLINQETGMGPSPLPDYCGGCTRCLTACPTRAITEPHWVDSRLCISYWTLEKRGALEIDDQSKRAMGGWIAGCDLCQEACPFNTKPVKEELSMSKQTPEGTSAEHLREWQALLREDVTSYKTRVEPSALSRIKPAQFSRNLAITLANAIELHPQELAGLGPLIEARLKNETDSDARQEWMRCLGLLKSS